MTSGVLNQPAAAGTGAGDVLAREVDDDKSGTEACLVEQAKSVLPDVKRNAAERLHALGIDDDEDMEETTAGPSDRRTAEDTAVQPAAGLPRALEETQAAQLEKPSGHQNSSGEHYKQESRTGRTPHITASLQQLVASLGSTMPPEQQEAAAIVLRLRALDDAAGKEEIAETEGGIESLVALLSSASPPTVQEAAAGVLCALATGSAANSARIASEPDVVPRLVNLLGPTTPLKPKQAAASALWQLDRHSVDTKVRFAC